MQQADGKFEKGTQPIFEQLKMAEDVVAVLEDFNQDGTLDLYVGSGGNESTRKEFFNFDRLFLNDGKGNFFFSMNSLPPIAENTSTLAVQDVNGDGAPDIFVGASIVTGNYGEIPKSYLLLNDGSGQFKEATTTYFGEGFQPGMVKVYIQLVAFDAHNLAIAELLVKHPLARHIGRNGLGIYRDGAGFSWLADGARRPAFLHPPPTG